jgi:hypothetical protein
MHLKNSLAINSSLRINLISTHNFLQGPLRVNPGDFWDFLFQPNQKEQIGGQQEEHSHSKKGNPYHHFVAPYR